MRYKRRRPKNARAGCLLCHPSKVNGTSKLKAAKVSDLRRMLDWCKPGDGKS